MDGPRLLAGLRDKKLENPWRKPDNISLRRTPASAQFRLRPALAPRIGVEGPFFRVHGGVGPAHGGFQPLSWSAGRRANGETERGVRIVLVVERYEFVDRDRQVFAVSLMAAGIRTANSSPPMRATQHGPSTALASTSPARRSKSSPAAWPD